MIGYNDKFITKDGRPWFPVMGEYQFSRSNSRFWRDGIEKMKALGCNTVQSYVIWIHHEEIEGKFNFRGNNNLRKFLREIKDAGMMMCLRIGPWIHGEVRNGGFPDWIFEKDFVPRSDDPEYMAYVERYIREIYKQCEGYMLKDGGPIFAIQVENEYAQSAWGEGKTKEDGDRHVNNIIALLKKIGFDVPVYFATAWGDAAVGDALPCWGGYCEAPWENHVNPLPPSSEYLIKHNPNSSPIGEYVDRPITMQDFTVSKQNYPYLTIELGTGNQMTKVRRPICLAEDSGAMTLCRLAQGVASLGYYVYHGGMNPIGALTTMQEYHHPEMTKKYWGFACDLNEINYDFQGAISMYGKMSDMGYELKLWALLATEFNDILTPADTVLPSDAVEDPNDFVNLRYSLRKNGNCGMVFFNNFVRHYDVTDKKVEVFKVEAGDEEIVFPTFTLKNGQYCAFPFNLKVGNGLIKYATATPYCILNGKDLVMWSHDGKAEIDADMRDGRILLLTKNDAKKAFKINKSGANYLIIADGEVFIKDGKYVLSTESTSPIVKVYPKIDKIKGFTKVGEEGDFAVFSKKLAGKTGVKSKLISRKKAYSDYEINVTYPEIYDNVFLSIDFSGDLIDIFVEGEKVSDTYYNGIAFKVGLKHHDFPKTILARVYPLKKDDFVFVEKQPKGNKSGVAQSIDSVTATTERTIKLDF